MKNTLLIFFLLFIIFSTYSQSVLKGIKLPENTMNISHNHKRGLVTRCDSAYEYNLDKKINKKFYFFYDKNMFIKEQGLVLDTISQKFRSNYQKNYDYDLNGNLISSKNYEWNTELKKLSLTESIDYLYTSNSILSKKTKSTFEETSIISSAFNPTEKIEQLFKYDGQNCVERVTITSILNQTSQTYNQSLKKEEYEYDSKGNIININSYSSESLQGKWNRTNQYITRKFNNNNQLIYTLDSTANMEGYPIQSLKYTIYKNMFKYNNKNQVIAIDRFMDDNHTSKIKLQSRTLYEYEPLKVTYFASKINGVDTINPYEINYYESKNLGDNLFLNTYYFITENDTSKYNLTLDNNYSVLYNTFTKNEINPISKDLNLEFFHRVENEISNSFSKKVLNISHEPSGSTELFYTDLETTSITGINNSIFSIYPNPTTDVLHIEIGDTKAFEGYRYRILDLIGKEVYSELVKNALTEIPLKTLGATGMYQLEVVDSNNTIIQTNKIVLQ